MNGSKRISCCAIVGTLLAIIATRSQAEPVFSANDGLADPASAAEQPPAEAEAGAHDICRCVGDGGSPAVRKIEDVLGLPLASPGLDFVDTPLEEIVSALQDAYKIPVQLDRPALDEIGLDSSEPVTISLNNVSLRSAMRLMLEQLQLTYMIRDEVLMITTRDAAEKRLTTCVYDVRGIADVTGKSIDFDSLIDTIVSCIETESWAENGGGEAQIRPVNPGLLVISQAQSVHEEIRALLETLRDLRGKRAGAAEVAAIEPASGLDEVQTRSYVLQISQPGDTEKVRKEIYDLIVNAIPDEKWTGRLDDGQPVVLSVLPDRVVLRHTAAVHDEVQALLVDSGVAAPIPAAKGETAGRGEGEGGGFFQVDRDRND
jgi:hypothetical protein